MEYLRSIFVSVDFVLSGYTRKLLHRPAPESPPMEIREGATTKILGIFEQGVDLEHTHIGNYCGFFSRISALVIDLFILGVTLTIIVWFIDIAAQFLQIDLSGINSYIQNLPKGLVRSFVTWNYFVLYQTLFWVLFGNTPGQAFIGIRVLTRKGEPPGLIRSFLRASIGINLSISLFLISIPMTLIDKRNRALHDVLFRTVVVYTWDAKPSKRFLANIVEKLTISPET
jgi:uncharacterized RDD family membrane protein YckC